MPAGASPSQSTSAPVVRVEHISNGLWEVELPGDGEPVTCETFDDAQRIGYLCAAHAGPCELIVRDAYHRVVQHQLLGGPVPGRVSH